MVPEREGKVIQVKVRLIGAFRIDRFKEQQSAYVEGTCVEEVVAQLNIPRRALGTVLINGVHSRVDATLKDGDTLALLPILGGG
ncbi:MAG: MoaD/ThiS family protein [Desulfuromonadales bacterium]|jgi:molybdopterin converting factor small subunit|nr:MoaD/ThiS family protein [Desulfuromonadales bacterium]